MNIAYASVDSFVADLNRLIINPLIAFLFALAVVYFLYGVFEFISNQQSEEKKTKGKRHMIYGILGIVVMMGVFSILNLIVATFGLKDEVDIDPSKGTIEVKFKDGR